MKANKDLLKVRLHSLPVALAMSACLFNFTACDKYDLDETDPEGWGASIYSYLEDQGHYTNELKLINDLGLKNVLAKTGSKTMFVADDDAFDRFYKNNSWGVKSYDQLSMAQKKMLLLGAMINNSYQVNNLSSIEGPVEGQCMRRLSSQTAYDSISVVKPSDLPNMTEADWVHNTTWKKFKDRQSVVLMRDITIPPMIHFIEAQMNNNKITNDDYNFLYNYTTDRQAGDASVNGVQMLQQNIKCSNGFIHKMREVITPLQNMAEIIASKPASSSYNHLLERFCAPFYAGQTVTEQYNYQYGTNVDSVFQKRFFSEKSQGGSKLQTDDDNVVAKSLLSFDPEWNTYYNGIVTSGTQSESSLLQKNMAVMMVPSNEALEKYWNNEDEAGHVLRDQYGTWDNVPNDVVVELINNNMLSSFVESVPSKFDGILNDANDPMGVSKEDIDSVWLGCNGAVYLTNKVYSPTSFVSVLYPAVVNQNMKLIKWAVDECQYNVYLNSLNSYYSFFIPRNNALLSYIDPVSYGKTKTQIYRFHYDASLTLPVWASIYEYDLETNTIGDSIGEDRSEYNLKERLKDVLDTHIVIGNVEDGNTYYKTKGGTEIRVKNASAGANGMTVEGSLQINETGEPLKVSYVYDQTKDGNGKCYVLDEPIQTTRQSVIDVMRQHSEMEEFVKLLEGSSILETIHDEKHACPRENFSTFNTYNYTVYVPTNASIKALIDSGKLPTWDDVAAVDARTDIPSEEAKETEKEQLTKKIEDFLKYHIQDGALFIGAAPQAQDGYETACINSSTGKFERVYATLTNTDLTVKTSTSDENPRKVVKTPGLYNLMAREYQVDGTDTKNATNLYTSSSAVIHLIDGALVK